MTDMNKELSALIDAANELAEVAKLEQSGVRDGNGYWIGSDAFGNFAQKVVDHIAKIEKVRQGQEQASAALDISLAMRGPERVASEEQPKPARSYFDQLENLDGSLDRAEPECRFKLCDEFLNQVQPTTPDEAVVASILRSVRSWQPRPARAYVYPTYNVEFRDSPDVVGNYSNITSRGEAITVARGHSDNIEIIHTRPPSGVVLDDDSEIPF